VESKKVFSAFALLLVSGILNASSVAPLKYARRCVWENLWLIQSIVAMLVLPWIVVWATVPDPIGVYRMSGIWPVFLAATFGFGWGIGTLLYIIGVVMVGMSVSFAIILSLTATLGSLLPLLVIDPHELFSHRGHLLLASLGATVIGIVLCAYAGTGQIKGASAIEREHARRYFWRGIIVCILAGIFSPMLNFAFVFGAHITDIAVQSGAKTIWAPNALWAIVLGAAFGPNAVYCVVHLGPNTSLKRFLEAPSQNLMAGSTMGGLLLASIILYGIGAAQMGVWGPSAGWAINMSTTVFAATAWGVVTGEWKNVSRRSYIFLGSDLTAITISITLASTSAT